MKAQPSYAPRHARKARFWLLRLKSGEISAREVARLRTWLAKDARHQAAFERERTFLQGLAQQHALFRNPAIAAPDAKPLRGFRLWGEGFARPVLACAAVLVLAIGLFGPKLWLAARADHRTDIAPSSFTLADGTRVALDADSAIAVAYGDKERRIDLLRGRAWFDVAPGVSVPFVVTALGGDSRDIGTRFEVAVEDGQASTAVAEGIVDVSAGNDRAGVVRLHAGEAAHYRRGGPVTGIGHTDADAIAAWRNGEILFRGEAPKAAIERIGRYRNGAVWVLGDVGKGQTISGLFHTDQSDQAILVIAEQLGLKIRRFPGGALLVYSG